MPVLLASLVLVGGVNLVAYAANGKPLLLGRFNNEGRPSVVKNNGAGPALDLRSRPGAPSLKVSNVRRVPRLNADKVDGRDARALETQAYEFLLEPGGFDQSGWQVALDVPPGRYLASYHVVTIGGHPECWFQYPGAPEKVAFSYPTAPASSSATLTGAATLDTRGLGDHVDFVCESPELMRADEDDQSSVSLVALDRVQSTTINLP